MKTFQTIPISKAKNADWTTRELLITEIKDYLKYQFRKFLQLRAKARENNEEFTLHENDVPMTLFFYDANEPNAGFVAPVYMFPGTADVQKHLMKVILNDPARDVLHYAMVSTVYTVKCSTEEYEKLRSRCKSLRDFPEEYRREIILIAYEHKNGEYSAQGYVRKNGELHDYSGLSISGNYNDSNPDVEITGGLTRMLNNRAAQGDAIIGKLTTINDNQDVENFLDNLDIETDL